MLLVPGSLATLPTARVHAGFQVEPPAVEADAEDDAKRLQ